MPRETAPRAGGLVRPADTLQRLSPGDAWAFADSNVLQAIARNERARFGPRGALLRAIVGALSKVGLGSVIVGVIGFGRLIGLMRRQGGPEVLAAYPRDFFVGFGAGSEEPLYAAFAGGNEEAVARLDQGKPSSFGTWHRVRFLRASRVLFARSANASNAIRRVPTEFAAWRVDLLTSAAIRVGQYAFMRAWFEELREKCCSPREVAFLAADTPAFAAVDVGLPTRYLQHGLVRHSLVLPRFERVTALTPDEAVHFRRRLPAASVETQSSGPFILPSTTEREVLVASVYAPPEEMQRVESFLLCASRQGWTVRVRPHPREDRAYWREASAKVRILLEDQDSSMRAALARLRPRLVVSWYSTALADALSSGVLPVTVCAADDPNVQDMVYPLFARCLRWPEDERAIAEAMNDDVAYRREVARLRQGWDTVPS